ncbi:hypothetical protein A7W90_17370 [Clostridium sp. Bc-iso-3]|nr:hypothetical protein A7W90_17370 [Clostridium sp. Bc-iso-3]
MESKKDDELYGSLKDELSELGYPEFSQMLNCYPNVLCNYIKSSFQLELLEGCLNSNNQNDLKYIINSIDYLEIIGEDVIVKGSVFEASK